VSGRVIRVSLGARGDRWLVDAAEPSGSRRLACRALMLTGPPRGHSMASRTR
jgi:hypothetical protein